MFLYTMDGQQLKLYAARMILWLVALPGFLIISSFSGIVDVISVVPATFSLFILGPLRAIIIAHWAQ